jgi:hypothetical protein
VIIILSCFVHVPAANLARTRTRGPPLWSCRSSHRPRPGPFRGPRTRPVPSSFRLVLAVSLAPKTHGISSCCRRILSAIGFSFARSNALLRWPLHVACALSGLSASGQSS